MNTTKVGAIPIDIIMDTVLDGFIIIDQRGIIRSFNSAATNMFLYQPEEVIGKNVKVLMPSPYKEEHDQYLTNYATTGERKIIGIGRQVTAQRKDGTYFPIELSVNEMDITGSRMFLGTVRDISDKLASEKATQILSYKNQEITRYETEVAEKKSQFNNVVKATGIVLWEYDSVTKSLYTSGHLSKLLGVEFNGDILPLSQWQSYIHQDDLEDFLAHWGADFSQRSGEYHLTYRVVLKSGDYIWIRESGSIEQGLGQTNQKKVAGFYTNVTRRKLEEEVHNRFYSITLETDKTFEEKLNEVINLGFMFLELEFGLVAKIENEQVKTLHFDCLSESEFEFESYESAAYCQHVFGKDEISVWHNQPPDTMTNTPFYKSQPLNAFIGTSIFVNQRPYGAIYFASAKSRTSPFTNREKVFLRLVSQWISTELSRESNLKEVQDSQKFLQLVQDVMPDLIFVKDEEFKIVRANHAFMELYPESERGSVLGTTTVESYNKAEADVFLAQDRIALSQGYSEVEETIHFPNGEKKTLFTKKIRFQNQDNNTYILGVGHDITDRVNALEKLAESDERYKLAVTGSSVGLWDWNVKTGELFWSDRFKELLGLTDEKFKPKYQDFYNRIHPDDREKTENAINKHLKDKVPYDVEYRLRREDNSYVWVHARGQAIWNDKSEATRMAGSVDDISIRKQALQELIRSNKELERFAYVASHDLQEPLRMVANFTQLLKKKYGDLLDETGIEYLDYAANGATKMQGLVKDLLKYASIGNQVDNIEKIDLNLVKTRVTDSLYDSIQRTNATIEWPTMPTITGELVQVSSIFQNIISNSIKYKKPDETPQIKVNVESSNKHWLFSISDNGIGMKQQYCKKIFEPFRRLHRKEDIAGTGMGLSICRKIIEEMEGEILAYSKLNQGTTIEFTIPKNKEDL